jgi:hypothetical protein
MTRTLLFAVCVAGAIAAAFGQTTQGMISGRIVDSISGRALARASVQCVGSSSDSGREARTDAAGYFVVPLLSPATYRLQVSAAGYQTQDLYEVEVRVAGRLDFSFRLRPLNDVWETGQYRSVFFPGSQAIVNFYGPDVDTSRSRTVEPSRAASGSLEASVSQVVDPQQIQELPLAGRDIYTTLILQPGVTADTDTSGGLGLSVNGQRPTSSNFLLDGVENNNYLVTGPLVTAAPEAIQEYRISTNSFSAEYGGTAGVLANAVTRAGGSQWHGVAYVYAKNDALNANDFQRNRTGLPRPHLHETEPGFQAGGPIRANRLFNSTSFEYFRSRGYGDPVTVKLPTTGFVNSLESQKNDPVTGPPASAALSLLQSHPWAAPNSTAPSAPVSVSLPSFVNRSLFLERLDYTPAGGVHHLMGRVASARVERPQFIWSPYQGFDSPLLQDTLSMMAALTSNLGPRHVNEARLSWSDDDLSWDRAHPEIATLTSDDGALLPGSLSAYAYKNRSRTFEFTDQFVWSHGPHLVKLGGGVLLRAIDGYLTFGRDGEFAFETVLQFGLSAPYGFAAAVDRIAPKLQIPSFERQYTYNQFHFFAQDTYRVMPRLTLNYGLRYENFGAPRGTGSVKDLLLKPGAPGAEIAGAQLLPEAAGQPIYARDNRGWAARLGGSYALTANGRTLLRGGSGIFYDRPYDNLWRNVSNNNFSVGDFIITTPTANYLATAAQTLPQFANQSVGPGFPLVTWIDARIRNAYVWSSFLGVQQELARRVTLEVNGLETLGRRLISTDVLNRGSNTTGSLPEISYLANQGSANYSALTALTRYHTSNVQFQAAYTWSHSIDNQSALLAGDFFDLSFVSLTGNTGSPPRAAFSRAGDLRVDRGNSDFDQRQNLVLMGTAAIPNPRGASRAWAPLRDWKLSGLAAFRTGFPYSIYASTGYDGIINRRGNLVNQVQEFIDQPAPHGGRILLSPAAFADPSTSTPLGNTGRNAIAGPGLYNADFSVSRSLAVRKLGEAGRIELRADLFNALNHANLGNPDSTIGSGFGVALYGRKPAQSGFPGLIPLTETARQIQLMVRVKW